MTDKMMKQMGMSKDEIKNVKKAMPRPPMMPKPKKKGIKKMKGM